MTEISNLSGTCLNNFFPLAHQFLKFRNTYLLAGCKPIQHSHIWFVLPFKNIIEIHHGRENYEIILKFTKRQVTVSLCDQDI